MDAVITEDESYDSLVTILAPDGTSQYMGSVTTPGGPLFTSSEGVTYFICFGAQIKGMADAWLRCTTSMSDQEFMGSQPVYEGVGVVTGTWGACDVKRNGMDLTVSEQDSNGWWNWRDSCCAVSGTDCWRVALQRCLQFPRRFAALAPTQLHNLLMIICSHLHHIVTQVCSDYM